MNQQKVAVSEHINHFYPDEDDLSRDDINPLMKLRGHSVLWPFTQAVIGYQKRSPSLSKHQITISFYD